MTVRTINLEALDRSARMRRRRLCPRAGRVEKGQAVAPAVFLLISNLLWPKVCWYPSIP